MKNTKLKDTVLWAILLTLAFTMMAGVFQEINLGCMSFSCWVCALSAAAFILLEWVNGSLYQE